MEYIVRVLSLAPLSLLEPRLEPRSLSVRVVLLFFLLLVRGKIIRDTGSRKAYNTPRKIRHCGHTHKKRFILLLMSKRCLCLGLERNKHHGRIDMTVDRRPPQVAFSAVGRDKSSSVHCRLLYVSRPMVGTNRLRQQRGRDNDGPQACSPRCVRRSMDDIDHPPPDKTRPTLENPTPSPKTKHRTDPPKRTQPTN